MKTQKIPLVLLSVLALSALPCCFSSRQEVLQKDSGAFITFTGNMEDARVSVTRDGSAIWTNIQVEEETRYAIKPGTYEVTVTRGGSVVVRRRIFLDDGNVFLYRLGP